MRNRLLLLILFLVIVGLAMGVSGGCGGISERVSYGNPNWMPDGRIVADKVVERFQSTGLLTSKLIFWGEYIVTMRDDGSDEREVWGGENKHVAMPVASPMGNYIAYINEYNIDIITADGSREVKSIACGEMPASFDWSPDETRIAYSGSTSKNLYVVNISDEARTKIATSAESVAWRVGEKIVYDGDWVNVIDPSGENRTTLTDYSWKPQKRSSDEVVYEGKDGLYSIKVETLAKSKLFEGYEGGSLKLSFDGKKIASGRWGRESGIWVINIDGTGLKKLRD